MEKIFKKKIDFSIGIFDVISESIKEKVKQDANNCELYGLGVYTDEVVIDKYNTYPSKKFEKRMEQASKINGVDFVFKVNTTDVKELKKIVEQAYKEFLQKSKNT